jgi:hypothetical protein
MDTEEVVDRFVLGKKVCLGSEVDQNWIGHREDQVAETGRVTYKARQDWEIEWFISPDNNTSPFSDHLERNFPAAVRGPMVRRGPIGTLGPVPGLQP